MKGIGTTGLIAAVTVMAFQLMPAQPADAHHHHHHNHYYGYGSGYNPGYVGYSGYGNGYGPYGSSFGYNHHRDWNHGHVAYSGNHGHWH